MDGEGSADFQRNDETVLPLRGPGRLPRFADQPLLVKIGLAPAFAVMMLVLAAGCALWSQQRQLTVLDAVLAEDNARNQLEISAKAISSANGAFYHSLGWQMSGGAPGAVQAGLQEVLVQLDTARQNLHGVESFVPPSEQQGYAEALRDLDDYRSAVGRLTAFPGDNFSEAGRYIAPYELEREHAVSLLDDLAAAMNVQAQALAVQSQDVARRVAILAVAGVLFTLLLVLAVVWLVFAAMRRTVGEICHATESLAEGRLDIDLRPLRRNDEFGAIVRSLEVFEDNQRRLAMLRAEKKILEKRQNEVRALADLDELTGLLNRRAMVPLVKRQVQVRQERAKDVPPTCLAMIDLDYFKAVNDDYGHLAGDEALRIVAHACADSMRCGDALARWGGEEFLLMLPNTTPETAVLCLEQLREMLSCTPFDSIQPGLNLTISVGVAEILPGDTIEVAITRADQALYAAKRGGRNRVMLAEGGPVAAA